MSSASESGNHTASSSFVADVLMLTTTSTTSSATTATSPTTTLMASTTDTATTAMTTASSAEAIVAATIAAISSSTTSATPTGAFAAATVTTQTTAADVVVLLRDEWLWIFIGVCCVLGIVLNVIVVWSMLRTKCNGTHYFLLQLSICDICSLSVGAIELIYIQQQRWTFPAESCPLYLGLESFSSIATVYLLVALNLHTISTYTLARRTIQREDRHALEQQQQHLLPTNDDDDDYDDVRDDDDVDEFTDAGSASASSTSENHYAPILADTPPASASASASDPNDGYETPIQVVSITRPEHTYQRPCHQQHPYTRSLTIDYSQRQTSVSVVLPVLFVWFVAASASTPLFAFGSVLPSRRAPLLCGVVNFDPKNNRLLQAMVLAVRVAVPSVCLLLTAAAAACALRSCRKNVRPCGLEENVREILRLTLVLSVVFLLASEQRVLGSMLFEVWSLRPLMLPKYPRWSGAVALALSMVHWSASVVRPIVYWAMDGAVRSEVRRTLCWPTRGKKKSVDGARESERMGGRL